ncbi:hypothetical protein LLG90_25355 [Aromatoleum toluclasticum]|uniref:hypothetical protein n=1 Tax=Aromatoleum toluclasticum TaxID=92003 RepID=UPI001D191B1B|nr:hypothetical protein [Aromatoleum toluclasticum]MCC4118692.1 hypothetical protein [Aromatoleum toluclasticum]
MTTKKVIPLSLMRTDRPDEIDALHERLERTGYMRMMQIGEPRLSELVAKYKAKGYEVEVVPFVDDGDDGSAPAPTGGCGPGSCSSAASSPSCSSGGCGSGSAPVRRTGPRVVFPDVGTIYVRMNVAPATSA